MNDGNKAQERDRIIRISIMRIFLVKFNMNEERDFKKWARKHATHEAP